jgi:hypothetical protein
LFSVGAAYNEGLTTPPKGQINAGERTKNGKLGQTETEMPNTPFPHRSFFTKIRNFLAAVSKNRKSEVVSVPEGGRINSERFLTPPPLRAI